MLFILFFFFSSRRRHTRFDCDWSSDVCSSDLPKWLMQVAHHECYRLKRQSRRVVSRDSDEDLPEPEVPRSEEHTSELQSQSNLVCRLLLEKKKKDQIRYVIHMSTLSEQRMMME